MIFTLGHSTSSPEEFVAAARGIDTIIDVRSHPGSRAFPHFNIEEMERWLPEFGLRYTWKPALGGWAARHAGVSQLCAEMAEHGVDLTAYSRGFPKQRIAATQPPDPEHPSWTVVGFSDYSWFMTLPEFLHEADQLVGIYGASEERVALVCCEAQWFRCHRGMIADHLTWRGVPCFHLPVKLPKRETTPRFKPHVDAIGNRLERYDPEILEEWRSWCSQEKAVPSA